MENKIKKILIDLGISKEEYIEEHFRETRDRKDLVVLKCKKSGVLFLDKTSHINKKYYENIDQWVFSEDKSHEEWLNETYNDDLRRFNQIKDLVVNKSWMDFGTGAGGILDMMKGKPKKMIGIEPQKKILSLLNEKNFEVYSSIDDVKNKNFDVITMFHVLEHLDNPIEILKKLYETLNDNGVLIIEVPHAKDFLLSFVNLDEFKKFAFWSEHLILHTRNSLEVFIKEAGFNNVVISNCQRYNFSNHLYWINNKKSGGHKLLNFFNDKEFDKSYENILSKNDMCDTLIAYAYKK